jgi:hypothetical protein
VDLAWRDGRLSSATLRSLRRARCRLRYGDRAEELQLARGATVVVDEDLTMRSRPVF